MREPCWKCKCLEACNRVHAQAKTILDGELLDGMSVTTTHVCDLCLPEAVNGIRELITGIDVRLSVGVL